MFILANFTVALVGTNVEKCDMQICDCNICSSLYMKQHSRDCIKFWNRGDHQSILKHLEVNIQKIFTVLWVEEFQEMIHFIIINCFNWSGVWICNWFIFRLNWKLLSGDFNITIINGMMIILKLPIPGELGNRIIPLRESGIQFPGTQIIPLRESGI